MKYERSLFYGRLIQHLSQIKPLTADALPKKCTLLFKVDT